MEAVGGQAIQDVLEERQLQLVVVATRDVLDGTINNHVLHIQLVQVTAGGRAITLVFIVRKTDALGGAEETWKRIGEDSTVRWSSNRPFDTVASRESAVCAEETSNVGS